MSSVACTCSPQSIFTSIYFGILNFTGLISETVLVETSDIKAPPASTYGSGAGVYGMGGPADGHVPRNIRLMLVGIDPEATQAAYRVGDSSTNIITPLMPYFALVLGFARRYRSDTGIGTLIALMLPYSLALLAGWSVLLGVWIGFGWPLGAG